MELRPAAELRALRVAVAAAVVWQLAQGWRSGASEFEKSYWLVTYEHGFVRRGLGGELLRLLPGQTTPELVLGAALGTSILSALAVLGVIVALARRGTRPALWLALLLAASPFTLEAALNKHRPDQLGLVVLAMMALWGGRRWAQITSAVLLATLVFVHEGTLVSYGLFILPLVVREGRWAEWRNAAAFFAPAGVATGIVLVWGRASPAQVDALLRDPATVALLQRPTDTDYSVLPYLGDSLRDSFAVVAAFPVEKAVLMVLWAVLLAAVHAGWLSWSRVSVPGTWLAWLPALAGFAFVHVTAVDWQRWTSAAFTGLLIVAAALLPARAAEPTPRRPVVVWAWIAVAAYLATRPAAGSVGWRDGWAGFLGYWTWPL